jgi:hypothetical protein
MVKFHTLLFCLVSVLSSAQNAENKPASADSKQVDEFAKKKTETRLSEVISTDSTGAPELVKRASVWIKNEHLKYKKTEGGSTGSMAECLAVFPVKPKELNPEVDYSGKISMKVSVECKTGKYRYTISEIRHISRGGATTGGSIDNPVPECGSMTMHDIVWKKLKGEALTDAGIVVEDLKEAMKIKAVQKKEDW